VIIRETATGTYKPLGVSEGAYVTLPEGSEYAGVATATKSVKEPLVGIMYSGEVNDEASPYPVTDELKAALKSAIPTLTFTTIDHVPDNFKQWVHNNKERIAAARERGTEPYFLRNNAQQVDGILNADSKLTPQQIAEQRRWAERNNVQTSTFSNDNVENKYGLTPQSDRVAFRKLVKQAKRDSKGYRTGILYNIDLFYTHRMTMSANDRNCLLSHAFNEYEINAIKIFPSLINKMSNPRYEPLNTSRANIKKKIKDGAMHFVAYDIIINEVEFVLKTEVINNNHKYVVEHPYSLKIKKK
jgi:hypothetical protein